MSKNWYPVIDYVVCAECGLCVKKCPHNVYDVRKAPTPVVVNPYDCVQGCHGCGNRCPNGAITYVGDNTGWTPPNGDNEEGDCGCGCDRGCGCE
ncbi:MAG TPA: 4Fe-4S ferredoxin [Clostridiales bacterium]|nr:4Fe-4S ferredoxin [Clostridiales bacterium]